MFLPGSLVVHAGLPLMLWDRAVPGLCVGEKSCRGTDTGALLPVGGSVWFTLSWLMMVVLDVVVIGDI